MKQTPYEVLKSANPKDKKEWEEIKKRLSNDGKKPIFKLTDNSR